MLSPQVGLTSDPGRFQPGTLTPVKERPESERQPGRKDGSGKSAIQALRAGHLGAFDLALLLAEIASGLVVAWLVGQYIYTVYFDTAPHRVATPHASAPQVSAVYAYATGTATHTPTQTPTPIVPPAVMPLPQGLVDGGESDAEVWNSARRARTQRSSYEL